MDHLTTAVTRTLRAAVKLGDDYITLEEVITLPPGASDEQIREAVATGLRIYETQRTAIEAQIADLRSGVMAQPSAIQMRDPDGPASEKQRNYMDYLLKELNWSHDRLATFAADRQLNLLTLTKQEASKLIDELKDVLAGQAEQSQQHVEGMEHRDAERTPPIPIGERVTQRQLRALERLVDERGMDLEGELRARFGDRQLADLSMDEAGQLLSEWQQRPRAVRPVQR